MSIEAKTVLMSSIERQLGGILTAENLAKVLTVISETLTGYMVEKMEEDKPEEDDLLRCYIETMQVQGRSPKTVERYAYIIGKMMRAVKAPTQQITVYHLRKYLADEKSRGVSDRTLDGERQVFSAYFNWLQREGLIEKNPTANLGAIRYQKKEMKAYSETDIERLKFGAGSLRDRAIISFLASTGCRISEMTQLNREDVDLQKLKCKVLGKGNKERTVYLSQVAGMILSDYLKSRKDALPALFIGKRAERLQPGGVRCMLVKLGIDTHVDHVHPHKFRRTLATNLIRHGMPIQEVAYILGHEKLDTTMKYVVLDKTNIKNTYQRYA